MVLAKVVDDLNFFFGQWPFQRRAGCGHTKKKSEGEKVFAIGRIIISQIIWCRSSALIGAQYGIKMGVPRERFHVNQKGASSSPPTKTSRLPA